MNTLQKVTLGLVAAFVVAIIMIVIDNITGWKIGILVGWFPVTAWFATMEYIKFREGKYISKTSFPNVLMAFGIALIMIVIGTMFKTPAIILGIICGLIYNIIIHVEPINKSKS